VGIELSMVVVEAVNAAVRFLLELGALAAFGYQGFRTGRGRVVRTILAIGTPLAAAVAWAVFGAPGAPRQLHGLWHLGWKS
jgi:hypothetical protein